MFLCFCEKEVAKMEIAPVGINMTYANAGNAGQVQHNMNHAIALQQDTEAAKQKEEAELRQTQVKTKSDAEGGTIKDDPERNARGGGYFYNPSKRKKKNNEPEENLAIDPRRGRLLDISL